MFSSSQTFTNWRQEVKCKSEAEVTTHDTNPTTGVPTTPPKEGDLAAPAVPT